MLVNSMKEHSKRAALYAAISISLVPCFGLLTFPSVVSPPSGTLCISNPWVYRTRLIAVDVCFGYKKRDGALVY